MDPDKLEEQRARVLQIREGLPEFQYGRDDDEDYEPGVQKDRIPMRITKNQEFSLNI